MVGSRAHAGCTVPCTSRQRRTPNCSIATTADNHHGHHRQGTNPGIRSSDFHSKLSSWLSLSRINQVDKEFDRILRGGVFHPRPLRPAPYRHPRPPHRSNLTSSPQPNRQGLGRTASPGFNSDTPGALSPRNVSSAASTILAARTLTSGACAGRRAAGRKRSTDNNSRNSDYEKENAERVTCVLPASSICLGKQSKKFCLRFLIIVLSVSLGSSLSRCRRYH